MLETVLWSIIYGVLAIVAALIAIHAITSFRAAHPRNYEEAMGAYLDRARARGLTEKEIQQELSMRRAYVRLRGAVSDAVLADARFYDLALKKAVSEEATMLAKFDGMDVANRFRKWIGELRTADILYQDAYDAMGRYLAVAAPTPRAPTEIEIASVTILPPTR